MPESSVTVVIPNYNGIAYIRDCLDSLLSGTVVPEIIVVDNASTDGSREVVEKEYAGRIQHRVLPCGQQRNTPRPDAVCHAA